MYWKYLLASNEFWCDIFVCDIANEVKLNLNDLCQSFIEISSKTVTISSTGGVNNQAAGASSSF